MDHIRTLIEKEIEALRNIPIDGIIDEAVTLIIDRVHNGGGKVVVSGMGKAGQVGHNISTTLCSTGTQAVFLHPSEAQHGDLGLVQANDVLLLVSNSGKTREIIELAMLTRRMYPEIPIICLTGKAGSEIEALANVSLTTGDPQEICPLGLTPTTSTTCMMVVGDILVVLLMKKIDFTKEAYAMRHHSGYLGKKARS